MPRASINSSTVSFCHLPTCFFNLSMFILVLRLLPSVIRNRKERHFTGKLTLRSAFWYRCGCRFWFNFFQQLGRKHIHGVLTDKIIKTADFLRPILTALASMIDELTKFGFVAALIKPNHVTEIISIADSRSGQTDRQQVLDAEGLTISHDKCFRWQLGADFLRKHYSGSDVHLTQEGFQTT